jgi:hypothetical protein
MNRHIVALQLAVLSAPTMKSLLAAALLVGTTWTSTAAANGDTIKWKAIESLEHGKVGCQPGRNPRWHIVVADGLLTASRDDQHIHWRRVPLETLADDGSGKVEFTSKRGEHIEFWFDRGPGPRKIRVFSVWNNCVRLFDPL